MDVQNIGLANRRLQPLGHISAPGIYYLFGPCRSNLARDSSDSGDSCDSGEVAKEVTPLTGNKPLRHRRNHLMKARKVGHSSP